MRQDTLLKWCIRVEHTYQIMYDTRRTRISEVSNSKNIC